MSLSNYVDALVYSDYVFTKSKGKLHRSGDGWYWTLLYLKEYGDTADFDNLLALFSQSDLQNEIEVVRQIFKWDEYVE